MCNGKLADSMLRSVVRCSVRLVVGLSSVLTSRLAHAEEPAQDPRATFGLGQKQTPTPTQPTEKPTGKNDPRDLFGLGKKPGGEEPPPDCDEPHVFGCATVTDPLDETSPYTLSTWLTGSYLPWLTLSYPVAHRELQQIQV